ncbi:unnamed protein product [Paramecium primaurelia]|uniref:UBC core domain-containing protein n=1 Tax=Paramecium primaurelia TaxID=5886 RepID=A0A8S1LDY1_PARPR|nr:unnamed protein product [Paramecium primaurelia]
MIILIILKNYYKFSIFIIKYIFSIQYQIIAINVKQIKQKLKDLTIDSPLSWVKIIPDPNCRLLWNAIVAGPEGTSYQGGKFKLSISFPENYPFQPPNFQFQTKIFHPNIDHAGYMCYHTIERYVI